MDTIYLDHIAGTPVHPEVVDTITGHLRSTYGNPQSIHGFGEQAREVLDTARGQVAGLIGASPEEISFTSSGTESNNLALKGVARAYRKKGNHIILSAIEHQSLLHSVKGLEKEGFTVTLIPVDPNGLVDPEKVRSALTDQTILVSIMYANAEVGTIQPIPAIAAVVKEAGVIFHTDAVAAAGIIPVNVHDEQIDALSLSGSQFYGPKGAAALYVKKGIRILPLMEGGIQEEGRRPSTENLAGIAGLGKAAQLAGQEMEPRAAEVSALRDRLVKGLMQRIEHLHYTGHPEQRLPHHASFCVEFVEGEAMLLTLTMQGVAVSSGSACTSKALKASHVLLAMGIEDALAQGSLVFSLGTGTTEAEVDKVIDIFPPIVDKLRNMSPLYTQHLKSKEQA